jgi:hypothetical protein
MKITRKILENIIKEEIEAIVAEQTGAEMREKLEKELKAAEKAEDKEKIKKIKAKMQKLDDSIPSGNLDE